MKKVLYTLVMFFIFLNNYAQNVGIGTTNPLARLHVTDSNVLFTAPVVTTRPAGFSLPVSGSGARFMWIPQLGAFRAGTVTGPTWNADSIGLFSFAAGFGTRATGNIATAMGQFTNASGTLSTAIGGLSQASGNLSVAMGYSTIASGNTSTAMGNETVASGTASTAMGDGTEASGLNSTAAGSNSKATNWGTTAFGLNTKASGAGAVAMGVSTIASGTGSTTMGGNVMASSYGSVAMGQYNDTIAGSSPATWVAKDPVLYIGNGDNPDFVHNATVIYKNGDADLNGYTRLGEITDGSPRIKIKKFTATMPATQGGITFVAHGITSSKILSISALTTVGQYQIIPNHMQAGFQYTLNVDGSNIAIGAVSGNSASVLNMPVKILVTYEE